MAFPICIYPSLCDGEGHEPGKDVNGGGEIQVRSWVRVLQRACLLGRLCSRRRLSQLGKQSRAQGRFALQAVAELLLPSPAGSPALAAPRNPELEAEDKAGTRCPRLRRVTTQSTAPVAPLESGGAGLGLFPSSNAVSHLDVGGREAEEDGDGYY